jgi:hypothetical protein
VNASRCIKTANGVASECQKTNGRIVVTSGVHQKRCRAGSSIVVSGVKVKRPSAKSGIEIADGIGKKRKETNCRVVSAASQAEQSLLAFCRVASRIAAIRGWTYRLRSWQKSKTNQHKRDEKQLTPSEGAVNGIYYRSNSHIVFVLCSTADLSELQ